MEKELKRKPLSSSVSVKACNPMEGVRNEDLWWEDFRKKYLLSLEWKRAGVTESESGDEN